MHDLCRYSVDYILLNLMQAMRVGKDPKLRRVYQTMVFQPFLTLDKVLLLFKRENMTLHRKPYHAKIIEGFIG